ncbi:MAG: glycosyltransferase family 2 protein [Bacteroidota bacterium]
MNRIPTPELSVIIPCFNEAEVIPLLIPALEQLDDSLPFPVYFLFVDDGSTDQTLALITDVCNRDERFACLSLSRNFGHQNAVSAGLRHAKGDIVAVIDADLQDPPAVIADFVDKWREGYDIVYGIRQNRKEKWPQRLAYALFYRILKRIANIEVPLDAGDFSLMDRRVVDVINQMPEHNRFIRGLRGWVGFRQTGVAYERQERQKGTSKYTFGKLFKLALDGLISFSAVPLWLAGWMGAFSAMLGFGYMLYAFIARVAGIEIPKGWTSTIIIILFLGGIQLMVLGILGNYIGRIFDEVKNRPHYIANHTTGWLSRAIQVHESAPAKNTPSNA